MVVMDQILWRLGNVQAFIRFVAQSCAFLFLFESPFLIPFLVGLATRGFLNCLRLEYSIAFPANVVQTCLLVRSNRVWTTRRCCNELGWRRHRRGLVGVTIIVKATMCEEHNKVSFTMLVYNRYSPYSTYFPWFCFYFKTNDLHIDLACLLVISTLFSAARSTL